MKDRITKSLAAQFETHRIVVWNDPHREMGDVFDSLDLPDVIKIKLNNDEFGVKDRVLRVEKDRHFLIYRDTPVPPDRDNWILDIELAYGNFKANPIAMLRSELNLPERFDAVLELHSEFFKSGDRLRALKTRLVVTDTESDVRRKMLAVCVGAQGDDLDGVLEILLGHLAKEDEDTSLRLIERCRLTEFLWKQVSNRHRYDASTPSLKDFALRLFQASHSAQIGLTTKLSADAHVMFRRWKNDRLNGTAFMALSDQFAGDIGIEAQVEKSDFRDLLDADAFEAIDRVVIRALVLEVAERRATTGDVTSWVRRRAQTFWYHRYEHIYQAIARAAEFHDALSQAKLTMQSLADGVSRYAETWWRIDQLYRKFVFHAAQAGQPSITGKLAEEIENHYTNSYLTRLNEAWQRHVDQAPDWACQGIVPQRDFFDHHVGEFRRKGQRICVIVSDAMRYEVAHELMTRIRSVDRYQADITPMFGVLPSYTQLGMAALLPHTTLEIRDDSYVLVDGVSSSGLEARKKLLNNGRVGDKADAMTAADFMTLNRDETRARLSDVDVLYIYHDTIDATGDKLKTEDKTFDACENAIDEIIKLVKKLHGANASNVIVTADHGFLYQHRPIDESDFMSTEAKGDALSFINRRFVLGHGLTADQGLRHFTSAQAGFAGDIEMLIPKSINRLRRQGSGSRFVHGGATLQEVVVPVVTISKKRSSDVSLVDVAVVGGGAKAITSAQLGIMLYQETPASEKDQPRILRVGLWSSDGVVMSDLQLHTFDASSANPRDRETRVGLLLTREADNRNGQEVILKLEEAIDGTNEYRKYHEVRYVLKKSIATEFDF
jgi:uncharacterized protein (TIGR02687 family)